MSKLKPLLLLAVLTLGYAGWKAAPLLLLRSRIDHELQAALAHVAQDADPTHIGLRVSGRTFLEPEQFRVEKHDLYGRRIIRVDVRVPRVVNLFGFEHTHVVEAHYTHEIEVNEEALARSMEKYRAKQARAAREQANAERRARNLESAYADCEKSYGRGRCRVYETDEGDAVVQPVL
jgi:hypothetical protein